MDDTMTAVPMERPEVMALAPLAAQARDYDGQAKAISTQRAYRIAWTDFTGWCKMYGQPALPASPEPRRPPDSRTPFALPARHGPNRDAGDPPREGGGARPEGAGGHGRYSPHGGLFPWNG